MLAAALAPAVVSAALRESTALAVRGAAGGVANAAASAVVKGMLFDQLRAGVLSAAVVLTAVCGGLGMTGAPPDAPPGKAVAPAPRPAEDPAAPLVKQLGGEDFAQREAAAKALRALGMKAEAALRAGLKSDDPEVRAHCATALAEIRTDALAALAKAFDPAAETQPDHPIWRRFKAIAGDTRASRDLFAQIIKNAPWLRRLDAAEAGPEAAAQQYREALVEVGRHYRRLMSVLFEVPVWPCDHGDEAAYLMLLGSHPGTGDAKPKDPADAQLFGARRGADPLRPRAATGPSGAGAGPQRGVPPRGGEGDGRHRPRVREAARRVARPLHQLVRPVLRVRTGSEAPRRGRAAGRPGGRGRCGPRGRGAGRPARRRPARHPGRPAAVHPALRRPHARCRAPAADREKPRPASRRLRVDDGAIALALLLCDQDPFAYGFTYTKGRFRRESGRPDIADYEAEAFGFSSDEARAAAHQKAKEWLDKQKK